MLQKGLKDQNKSPASLVPHLGPWLMPWVAIVIVTSKAVLRDERSLSLDVYGSQNNKKMKLLAHGLHSSSGPTECPAEPRCLQQTESPVEHVQEGLWILLIDKHTRSCFRLIDSRSYREVWAPTPAKGSGWDTGWEWTRFKKQAPLCYLLSGTSDQAVVCWVPTEHKSLPELEPVWDSWALG